MPNPGTKPPNKRVDEIKTELTAKLWDNFEIKEPKDNRDNKILTFLIAEIAYLKAQNELIFNELHKE